MHESFLAQVDARSKLLLTLFGAVCTIVFSSLGAQLTLFAFSFVVALLIKRPTLLVVLYALMSVMMGLAIACTFVLIFFIPALGDLTVENLVIPFLRGLTMMNLVVGLAMSTRIENIMVALSQLKLPFMLTLPSTVMIRFIPTFAHDVVQVWETLKIRGWHLGFGMLCRHPLLSARLIFTPILFRAIKSSEALGVAAELKGLDKGLGKQASNAFSNKQNFSRNDLWLFIFATIGLAVALFFELTQPELGISSSSMRMH